MPEEIRFAGEESGATRAELLLDGRSVSRLWIVPFTIRIGRAEVRMDGIAGVGTEEEFRRRGFARRVLEAAVERMRAGDAALSMLYGIPGLYPKFGYATAGPDYYISLREPRAEAPLPEGWCVRPFAREDLPAIRRIYAAAVQGAAGAAARADSAAVWDRLLATLDDPDEGECRVVVSPAGELRAYAWQARGHWYTRLVEGHSPDALSISEAMALDPTAADALLSACCRWGAAEAARRPQPLIHVLLSAAPDGCVADAARYRAAWFIERHAPCGGSMVRVLNVERLLLALLPELDARWEPAPERMPGILRIVTEIGSAALRIAPEGCSVAAPGRAEGLPEVAARLPQAALARLALGAYPAADLLTRAGLTREDPAFPLLEALFPQRRPHMSLPDRF